ncbi:HORMA domain-containing protein 1 [Thoreauomyces humboldtii]|nr:HORMA domain-containing protein 1 [Thoreauomyces humboldtii]
MTTQMQRPRTGNETLNMTAQDSLNAVRHLLYHTVGAIAYIVRHPSPAWQSASVILSTDCIVQRGLFPEEHFKDITSSNMRLKCIRAGASPDSDEVMGWLVRYLTPAYGKSPTDTHSTFRFDRRHQSEGCFEALEKRYLKTMIFGIYLDAAEPDKLYMILTVKAEAYTFGFSYPDKDQWCITLDTNGKEAFKLQTKSAFQKATADMLRRLIILTQTLRPLPTEAYVTMKLLYYDHVTPPAYDPPHFRAGNDADKYYFGSRADKCKIGQVESPSHAANLHVQFTRDMLDPIGKDNYHNNFTDMASQEVALPADNLGYGFGSDDHCMEEYAAPQSQVSNMANQMDLMDLDELNHLVDDIPALERAPSPLHHTSGGPALHQASCQSTELDTQDLQGMLKAGIGPPSSPPGLSAASLRPPVTHYSSEDTCFAENSPPQSIDLGPICRDEHTPEAIHVLSCEPEDVIPLRTIPGARADGVEEMDVDKPACAANQETDDHPQSEPETPPKSTPDARQSQLSRQRYGALPVVGTDDDILDCPCGVNVEEGDLILCSDCKTWSHTACAGYRTAKDKRIPRRYRCYGCKHEAGQLSCDLEYVCEVALFRRGIQMALLDGIPSVPAFAKEMGVGLAQTRQIITRLIKEGFVKQNRAVAARPARGRKPAVPAVPQYQVLTTAHAGGQHSKWYSNVPFAPHDIHVKAEPTTMQVDSRDSSVETTDEIASAPKPKKRHGPTTPTHRDVVTRSMSRSGSVRSDGDTQGTRTLLASRQTVTLTATGHQLPTPAKRASSYNDDEDRLQNDQMKDDTRPLLAQNQKLTAGPQQVTSLRVETASVLVNADGRLEQNLAGTEQAPDTKAVKQRSAGPTSNKRGAKKRKVSVVRRNIAVP